MLLKRSLEISGSIGLVSLQQDEKSPDKDLENLKAILANLARECDPDPVPLWIHVYRESFECASERLPLFVHMCRRSIQGHCYCAVREIGV